MNRHIGHKMILASAGSGKTHTLVNRYIRLLALGVDPARIIALTFTRKAAGEFLQKIFLRLSGAASDPGLAADLSRQIEAGTGKPDFFRPLLVRLVHGMGDLQLGTIDSFFARVVGAFPYELGLTRPHRIMDEFEQNISRQTALEQLFSHGDQERCDHILQVYKDMTWGAEEKKVYSLFEENLRRYHSLFLEAREPLLWGTADFIFKEKPWWLGEEDDKDSLLKEIRGEVDQLELKKSELNAFDNLLEAFENWHPGLPLKSVALYGRLLQSRLELKTGFTSIQVGQGKLDIRNPLAGLLFKLCQLHVRKEVARRLVMTRSLGELIHAFDRLYEQSIREAGSLVFADLPMLLIKGLCEDRRSIVAEDIVYRLDGQSDHWLVDEFQDTSRVQWKVLAAFVEEILQDPSGERTFFYVGDIKQSIYRWRGGDSRLFDEIYKRYSTGQPGIEQAVLSRSWRSSPPVLDCVNMLFGKGVSPALVGEEVSRRWHGLWQEHEPSGQTRDLPGHAAWGLLDKDAAVEDGCIELIRTINPLSKGLSCAILMRRNPEVKAMTEALRAAGIRASMEGVVEIAMDNILGAWMRAFFTSLARPGERFPMDFLSLHGFAFSREDYHGLSRKVRHALTGEGYAEAVRRVIGFVLPKLPVDPFLARRAEQLLEAATRFERTGLQPLENFIRFMESAMVDESTLSSQVQVMTVHKAKGLDFDMVIVAGFGGDTLVRPGNSGLHVERSATGDVQWILDLPPKAILDNEPVLQAADASERVLNTFEALCLLYVATTRARMGLYCLATEPSRNSSQATWHSLFEEAFGPGPAEPGGGLIAWQREWGSADWHEQLEPKAEPAAKPVVLNPLKPPLPLVKTGFTRASSPSQESHEELVVNRSLRPAAGRRFGTRMHDFLATIRWVEFDDPGAYAKIVDSADPDLRERLDRLFSQPLGREVFARPERPCDLWREKPYILRRQSTVASGIIDRALLRVDSSGNPVRVVIYDFKTDALDPHRPAEAQLTERYALQLERYREAVSILTGLSPEMISTRLVPV